MIKFKNILSEVAFKYFKKREIMNKDTDMSDTEVDEWIDECSGYRDAPLFHNIIAAIEKHGVGYKGMNKARLKKAGDKIYKALQNTRGY